MATMKELAALLGVELGEEFRISDSQWLYKFDDNGLMHKTKDGWRPFEMESTLCGLFAGRGEIVKLPWKPKDGDLYWYAYTDGTIGETVFLDEFVQSVVCLALYAVGNCFRTKEEAEAHKNELIASLKAIYENGRQGGTKIEKPSVVEATRALKEYCTGRECSYCKFCVDKENGE